MVYYFKINRKEVYMLKNLQSWFDIVSEDDKAVVFLMCDDDELINQTQEIIDFRSVETEYITTDTSDEELRSIAGNVANERWQNAAMAHLTTFFHAKKTGISEYWNIDADDTMFCLPPGRVLEVLRCAEEYSDNNEISLFSLDMWRTKTWNLHWSFGITYTKNPEDWIEIVNKRKDDKTILDPMQPHNLDGFFSCLKNCEDGIASFYVENLRFVHYSDDFIRRPWASGLYHWKNGVLHMPVLKECLGLPMGEEIILAEIVNLDIGISDKETTRFMVEQCYPNDKAELIWRGRKKGCNI